jgi:hypothetical protein
VLLVEDESGIGSALIPVVLPSLVSCFDTLEVLHCPWAVFGLLPATGPSFPRLTELRVGSEHEPVEFPTKIWDMVASGRLPALATLSTAVLWGKWGGGEGAGGRLARAFEAVAGTLRRLTLSGASEGGDGDQRHGLPGGASYELGGAIGKLRRLRFLGLHLATDGWDYHAAGRGTVASGGCPELFQVRLGVLKGKLDRLTHEPSLIVPSVRDLHVYGGVTEEPGCSGGSSGSVPSGLTSARSIHNLCPPYRPPFGLSCLALENGTRKGHESRDGPEKTFLCL